jgi:photoactive yellow protein
MTQQVQDLFSFLRSKNFLDEVPPSRDGAVSPSAPPPRLRGDEKDDRTNDYAGGDSGGGGGGRAGNASAPELRAHGAGRLSFDLAAVGEKLRHASEAQLNNAPFGIVRVDDEGRVLFYNRYESELADVAPRDAMGQNFFLRLAPCSNNRLFYGRFKEGVRSGDLEESFSYTFTYKMKPTLVDVLMYRDNAGNNWVLVRKR